MLKHLLCFLEIPVSLFKKVSLLNVQNCFSITKRNFLLIIIKFLLSASVNGDHKTSKMNCDLEPDTDASNGYNRDHQYQWDDLQEKVFQNPVVIFLNYH